MRPSEVDYSSKLKPYYDTSNGEVLLGKEALLAYIDAGGNSECVEDLGNLLRTGESQTPVAYDEALDTSEWDPDRIVSYGKWILRIIARATEPEERTVINRTIIARAYALGLGPNVRKIRQPFGTLSRFYNEIGARKTHQIGIFHDWTLDDYVTYVRKVGGDRRPTAEDIRRYSQLAPNRPKPEFIHK